MQIIHHFHSKNYDLRPESKNPIRYIILHYTEMEFNEAVNRLCDPAAKVSSHYLIKKSGEIYQLVGDFYRAWHAGKSKWQHEEALNNSSIGIEIDNLGNEEFTDTQMQSVISLCKALMSKYRIHRDNVVGHSDIAPSRKIDPGMYFDWHSLAKNGIGINFPRFPESEIIFPDYNKQEIKRIQLNLKKIGYDTEVTGIVDKQTSDVFGAFQLHFNQKAILAQGGVNPPFNPNRTYAFDNVSEKILDLLAE